jgi:glycosyltransferase involved in cell wall biosynthesis
MPSRPPDGARLLHVVTVPTSLFFLRGQARFMGDRGISVAAISSPGQHLTRFVNEERVPTYAVDMPRRITPLRDLVAVWRIWRVLRRVRPHIVHAQTPKAGLLGMIAARLAGIPVRVYHIRGLPFMTAAGTRRRLLWTTEWVACGLSHSVLCVSHSIREVAVAEGVCDAGKIAVLLGGSGNGVDSEGRFDPRRDPGARDRTRTALGIPPNADVVGFVGRVVREKGAAELAAAWASLRETHPNARLLMVGKFDRVDAIPPDVAESLRRDPRVHLIENSNDMPSLYAAMDLLVLPTYREGFPNAPLEAASMSLPVVATQIPGCTDAVQDGVTGTLVPARDATALTSAIVSYLDDAHLRVAHGRAGRERALRDFRQEAIWEALYAHYTGLLARHAPADLTPPIAGGGPTATHHEEATTGGGRT